MSEILKYLKNSMLVSALIALLLVTLAVPVAAVILSCLQNNALWLLTLIVLPFSWALLEYTSKKVEGINNE